MIHRHNRQSQPRPSCSGTSRIESITSYERLPISHACLLSRAVTYIGGEALQLIASISSPSILNLGMRVNLTEAGCP